MRILSWAVDVGERQRGVLEAMQLAVGVQVVAERLLGDAVGRQRTLRLRLLEWQRALVGHAVDRSAARCEDDLAGPRGACPFEHVQTPDDVDLGVVGGPRHRLAHAHLRREMEHDFRLAAGDEIDRARLAKIELVERQLVGTICAGGGQVGERSGREIVDHVHRMALGE